MRFSRVGIPSFSPFLLTERKNQSRQAAIGHPGGDDGEGPGGLKPRTKRNNNLFTAPRGGDGRTDGQPSPAAEPSLCSL
ncbi:hypothetical protein niasHT_011396 [Heterodera trifolii]|uniref:Uncharacterized protein n=1 Tax=Heterodera trifolii TaxID=157864 RepID=A0ABD2LIA2_9BILA